MARALEMAEKHGTEAQPTVPQDGLGWFLGHKEGVQSGAKGVDSGSAAAGWLAALSSREPALLKWILL